MANLPLHIELSDERNWNRSVIYIDEVEHMRPRVEKKGPLLSWSCLPSRVFDEYESRGGYDV